MIIDVLFSENNKSFDVDFVEEKQQIDGDFGEVTLVHLIGEAEPYVGEYSVIPRVSKQVLETKNKMMTDDLTVCEIPYAEVTNMTGGMTASIG